MAARMVTVSYDTPFAPLVFDAEQVPDPGNYGFVYADDATSAIIMSVALAGPATVNITLNRTPDGANPRLRYAMEGYEGTREEGAGPRGCLRDSSRLASRYDGKILYNWGVHFEWMI